MQIIERFLESYLIKYHINDYNILVSKKSCFWLKKKKKKIQEHVNQWNRVKRNL